jgi:hypothetical protein
MPAPKIAIESFGKTKKGESLPKGAIWRVLQKKGLSGQKI